MKHKTYTSQKTVHIRSLNLAEQTKVCFNNKFKKLLTKKFFELRIYFK